MNDIVTVNNLKCNAYKRKFNIFDQYLSSLVNTVTLFSEIKAAINLQDCTWYTFLWSTVKLNPNNSASSEQGKIQVKPMRTKNKNKPPNPNWFQFCFLLAERMM